MDRMPDSWNRAKELFNEALEMEPSQRAAFLAQKCDDESLRQQVEGLLLNFQEAGTFLDDPVLDPRIGPPQDSRDESSAGIAPTNPEAGDPSVTAPSAEVQDPMVGRQLGAYKLVRRVGQGGMAAVYLAARADDEYSKQVAIKVVQPGLDGHNLLIRFRNERQTLASLDHPNIVKLLDGGSTPEGLPFLVMDYVEGCPIDDYCDLHKLCVDERLQVFCRVCEAVHYAHQRGVIHRDLKPGNILVTAGGTPKLLDFGIAKVLNPEPSSQPLLATQTGTRCMTPAYASPEQMCGKPITAATDVFSLGVVLYELLSGHRPYRLTQHTPAEIERAICEQDPETPSAAINRVETYPSSGGIPITMTPELVSRTREGEPDRLRRRLRGDLDNIVLKALQKEPERRYSQAQEFSQDIERHLQRLPVLARPGTLTYRGSKFVQRHKMETSAVVASLFVLLAALSFAFNIRGVRDRALGSGSGGRRTTQPLNPKSYVTAAAGPAALPVVSCENIANLTLMNTTLTSTRAMPTGGFAPPGTDSIQRLLQSLPAFCRVEGVVKPTSDSDIRFEVWMPSSGWNGKFRGVGNDGFGGSIKFDDMALALRRGYATASTDTGHRGNDDRDASWALHHPQKVIDVGYRAIHEMTENSKQIIRTFYGRTPTRSFFEGCSNGGRQGLMEAQRFPEDYDGILVGAPPIFATRILAAGVYNSPTDLASYIPPNKMPAISRTVLAACDAADGLNDGILNDPRQCGFDPSVLVCRGADSENCLTLPQVAQLNGIYRGLRTSKGEQLFPGYLPGGEEGEGGWTAWITGPTPGEGLNYVFGTGLFRNMVFDDPNWDFRTVTAEQAIRIAEKKIGPMVNTQEPDLQRFKAHGGKLILYNGWSDPEMPGLMAVKYYDTVLATMGTQDANTFLRLYMVPGMQHCYGGPGPNFFGQFDPYSFGTNVEEDSIPMNPQHNVSRALEQWVEQGVPPDSIIATKYVNDSDPAQGIKMTRPLCPYPQIAKYKGAGDTNDAANFVCTENNDQHRRTLSP